GGKRRYPQGRREGAGDRDLGDPEVGLHGSEEHREAVVQDPPGDRLRDGQGGRNNPPVMEPRDVLGTGCRAVGSGVHALANSTGQIALTLLASLSYGAGGRMSIRDRGDLWTLPETGPLPGPADLVVELGQHAGLEPGELGR